jgi:hypothetical protein
MRQAFISRQGVWQALVLVKHEQPFQKGLASTSVSHNNEVDGILEVVGALSLVTKFAQ